VEPLAAALRARALLGEVVEEGRGPLAKQPAERLERARQPRASVEQELPVPPADAADGPVERDARLPERAQQAALLGPELRGLERDDRAVGERARRVEDGVGHARS